MTNEVLNDIVEYAKIKLTTAYGYCGSAEGDVMAMIDSTDGDGNDIKISIKVESD